MERSSALIIFNGNADKSETREELNDIKNSLYLLDPNMHILFNKTSQEIKAAVNKFIEMDASQIQDIIIVVRSTHLNKTAEFATKDGGLAVYDDIITPLLTVLEFQDKAKLILTVGFEVLPKRKTKSNGVYKPFNPGKNVCIVSSYDKNFINIFIPVLIKLGREVIMSIERLKLFNSLIKLDGDEDKIAECIYYLNKLYIELHGNEAEIEARLQHVDSFLNKLGGHVRPTSSPSSTPRLVNYFSYTNPELKFTMPSPQNSTTSTDNEFKI